MVQANLTTYEPDRVRRNTSSAQLDAIDRTLAEQVRSYADASPAAIERRIDALQREWSVERYLQVNVSVIGLTTAVLALTVNRKWGVVSCVGLGFFLLHALQGFDPPLPLLRSRGVRTRREINREIYALKVMRGDFADVLPAGLEGARPDAAAALRAVGL